MSAREHDRLAAWLDGDLAGPERERFEERLRTDPALAAELARERELAAGLRRAFSPPDDLSASVRAWVARERFRAEPALARRQRASALVRQPRARRRGALRLAGVAAAALLVLVLARELRMGGAPSADAPGGSLPAGDELYAQAELPPPSTGTWLRVDACVAVDDPEPASMPFYVKERFGRRLALELEPDEVVRGAFSCGLGPTATVLETELRGCSEPVLLVVEEAGSETSDLLSAESQLNVFRCEGWGYVLSEVTPLAAPRLLARVRELE